MSKTVPFQTIQLSTSMQFKCKYSLIVKNISISSHSAQSNSSNSNNSVLSCAIILGQSGPGSHGNEGVLHIPQSPCITGTSPSDCFVSYPGHSLGVSYPSAEKQSVYSTDPANLSNLYISKNNFSCSVP